MRPNCIKRGKRSGTFGAVEGFCVAIFVSRELNPGFESFRTIGTSVGPHVTVREEMMIVDGRGFEALSTVLTGVGTNAGVSSHVKSQTVGDSESLSTDLKKRKGI